MTTPPLERDLHWDELEPILPYSSATANHITKPHMGSMANLGYVFSISLYFSVFAITPKNIRTVLSGYFSKLV